MEGLIKNSLIAMLIIASMVICVFMIFFLNPSSGKRDQLLTVHFQNIEKLSVGSRVNYAGKTVGKIDSIHVLEDVIKQKIRHNGTLYPFEVVLRIDNNIKVYTIDEISVMSAGLIGEKFVEITPSAPEEGIPLELADNKVIYTKVAGSLENLMKDSLTVIQEVAKDVLKNQIAYRTGETLIHLRNITEALDEPKALQNSLENISVLSSRATNSWDSVDDSLNNFNKLAKNGDIVFTKLANGEGTLGRILNEDELYLKLSALFNKGDVLLNDINHYGILFHLDKNWQRLRARRLNLLQRLQCPQEFRNYFNDEVDQIYTSINRVAMVLEMIEQGFECEELLKQKDYAKVFAELKRKIETLNDEVRSFNIQIFETTSVPLTELTN